MNGYSTCMKGFITRKLSHLKIVRGKTKQERLINSNVRTQVRLDLYRKFFKNCSLKFSALHWTCSKNLGSCLDCALRFLTNFLKMFLCMLSLTWIIAAKVNVIPPNYLSISLYRFDRFKRNLGNKETLYRWKKHVFFRLKFICKWSIIFLLFFFPLCSFRSLTFS